MRAENTSHRNRDRVDNTPPEAFGGDAVLVPAALEAGADAVIENAKKWKQQFLYCFYIKSQERSATKSVFAGFS